jgi:CheY-like chemotaxis protein
MMLSSGAQFEEQARCSDLGIACYLTKPVDHRELLRSITAALTREQTPTADVPLAMQAVSLPSRRLNVLLAEDNAVNQRLAVSLLKRRGHRVVTATNGLEALAAIEQTAFDVVLMDLQMPGMGGLEATAAIRAREEERGGHLRIVAMTAHALKGDRERCFAAGMDDYLSKPINAATLYETLERDPHVAASGAEAPAAVPPAPDHAAEPNHAVDVPGLMNRLQGDAALFAEVTRIFVEDCPARLVALREAIDARDAERIHVAAHTLKGVAGNLSARGLYDAALALEERGVSKRFDGIDDLWRRVSVEANAVMDVLQRSVAVEGVV